MIRSIRRVLLSLLGDHLVDEETLQTALCEVEKILNDRPLVKLTADPEDDAALTPSHILLLYRNPAISTVDECRSKLSKRWKRAQFMADQFWTKWRKEYLPTLQTAYRWLRRGRDLKIGNLVLLNNPTAPRGQWTKGVVTEVAQSSDGAVREVMCRTTCGIFRHDVRQLFFLEAAEECQNAISEQQLPLENRRGEC